MSWFRFLTRLANIVVWAIALFLIGLVVFLEWMTFAAIPSANSGQGLLQTTAVSTWCTAQLLALYCGARGVSFVINSFDQSVTVWFKK